MTIVWKEDLLREAAGQMAVQTARLLPREELPLSPSFQEKMGELLWRTKRQQKRRVMWQRAMAALLALVVAMGAVLAVSPQAQAAAKRWLMKITDVVTTSHTLSQLMKHGFFSPHLIFKTPPSPAFLASWLPALDWSPLQVPPHLSTLISFPEPLLPWEASLTLGNPCHPASGFLYQKLPRLHPQPGRLP